MGFGDGNDEEYSSMVEQVLRNLVDDASMSLATASSLAYGLEKKDNRTFLVFDLDGGIFDVSAQWYGG